MAITSDIGKNESILKNYSILMGNVNASANKIGSMNSIVDFKESSSLGQSENIINLQNQLAENSDYQSQTQDASSIMNAMDLNLGYLKDIASEMLRNLVQFRSSSGSTMELTFIAQDALERIQGVLNNTFNNKYLFSGTSVDVSPIDVENKSIVNNSNIIDGQSSNNYYKGGSSQLNVVVAPNYSISYGPLASDPVFQDLIASLHLAIEADAQNSDDIAMQAYTLLESAFEGIIKVRAVLGTHWESVENQLDLQTNSETYLNKLLSNQTLTDISTESMLFTQSVFCLQALYRVIAAQNKLNLSDYI